MPSAGYELGRAIAGTLGALRQPQGGNSDAFLSQLQANYTTQQAMDKAANERAMRLARESITADLARRAAAGDLDAQAELGAATLRTARTPSYRDFAGGTEGMFKLGQRRLAAEAVERGELGAANAALIPIANAPVTMNQVQGGYQVNRIDPDAAPVPLGTAQAQIAQRNASAASSYARAERTRAMPLGSPRGADLVAERAAQVEAIEADLGHPLTEDQRTQFFANGRLTAPRETQRRAPQSAAPKPQTQQARQRAGLNALNEDNREAFAAALTAYKSGKMSKQQAISRLRAGGATAAADLLERWEN